MKLVKNVVTEANPDLRGRKHHFTIEGADVATLEAMDAMLTAKGWDNNTCPLYDEGVSCGYWIDLSEVDMFKADYKAAKADVKNYMAEPVSEWCGNDVTDAPKASPFKRAGAAMVMVSTLALTGCASVNERVLECQRKTGGSNDQCFALVNGEDHAREASFNAYAGAALTGLQIANAQATQPPVYAPAPVPAPAPAQPTIVYVQRPIQPPAWQTMPQTPVNNLRVY